MARTINERLIRISSGLIPIDTTLENGSDVTITIQGTVTKIEYADNQDNTDNQIFVVKGTEATYENTR